MNDSTRMVVSGILFAGPGLLAAVALWIALRGRRRGWAAALALVLLTLPISPGIDMRSAETTRYFDSPDLLTDQTRTIRTERVGTALFGQQTTWREREFEGDRLIRETHREVLRFPILALLVAGVFLLRAPGRTA